MSSSSWAAATFETMVMMSSRARNGNWRRHHGADQLVRRRLSLHLRARRSCTEVNAILRYRRYCGRRHAGRGHRLQHCLLAGLGESCLRVLARELSGDLMLVWLLLCQCLQLVLLLLINGLLLKRMLMLSLLLLVLLLMLLLLLLLMLRGNRGRLRRG
jgi:hypothetical protein